MSRLALHYTLALCVDLDLSHLDRNQLLLLYLLASLSSSQQSPLSGLLAIREDFTEYIQLIEEMLFFLRAPDVMLCGAELSSYQSEYIFRFLGLILAPALSHPSNGSNLTHGMWVLDSWHYAGYIFQLSYS